MGLVMGPLGRSQWQFFFRPRRGLLSFCFQPTACAVGCTLAPLRGLAFDQRYFCSTAAPEYSKEFIMVSSILTLSRCAWWKPRCNISKISTHRFSVEGTLLANSCSVF